MVEDLSLAAISIKRSYEKSRLLLFSLSQTIGQKSAGNRRLGPDYSEKLWKAFRSWAVQIRRVPDSPAAMMRVPSGVVVAERMVSLMPGRFWLRALMSRADAVRS